MPLLGHIGSAWPGEGCVALGALPELGPRSKQNHYLAARALWNGVCLMGRGNKVQAGPWPWFLGVAPLVPLSCTPTLLPCQKTQPRCHRHNTVAAWESRY